MRMGKVEIERVAQLMREAFKKAKGNEDLQWELQKLVAAAQVKMDRARIELQYVEIGSDEYYKLVDEVNRFIELTYLKMNSKVAVL